MPTPIPPPIAAVIAVVRRGDAVLLVRRANPPDAGRWGYPGGKIDGGETIAAAALRELAEETGVRAEADRVLTALDAFEHDGTGQVRRHFLMVAVLCGWVAGEPVAADDALEARWVPLAELEQGVHDLCADVAEVARLAVRAGPEG